MAVEVKTFNRYEQAPLKFLIRKKARLDTFGSFELLQNALAKKSSVQLNSLSALLRKAT
jgi:hypothetical protein